MKSWPHFLFTKEARKEPNFKKAFFFSKIQSHVGRAACCSTPLSRGLIVVGWRAFVVMDSSWGTAHIHTHTLKALSACVLRSSIQKLHVLPKVQHQQQFRNLISTCSSIQNCLLQANTQLWANANKEGAIISRVIYDSWHNSAACVCVCVCQCDSVRLSWPEFILLAFINGTTDSQQSPLYAKWDVRSNQLFDSCKSSIEQ